MGRTSSRGPLALLASLARAGEATTEGLYERLGYGVLMRLGLIPYPAFRRTLAELEAEGLVAGEPTEDGSTLWRCTPRGEEVAGRVGPG